MAHNHIYQTTYPESYSLYSDCKQDLAMLKDQKLKKGVVMYAQCEVDDGK